MTEAAEAREEELTALEAIYGSQCHVSPDRHQCTLQVAAVEGSSGPFLTLLVHIPPTYPTDPPVAELESPFLSRSATQQAWLGLQDSAASRPGEVLLFQWVEWLKEQEWIWEEAEQWERRVSEEQTASKSAAAQEAFQQQQELAPVSSKETDGDLEELEAQLQVVHGVPFTEKRSTFQAHVAPVSSVAEVEAVMDVLLSNRKLAAATHAIMAYRIAQPNGSMMHDQNDDGESAAGGRLQHLLQTVDARNVVVVVTRWYGGILLGPDRFKHINNAARTLLDACGYIAKSGKKHKGSTSAGSTKGRKR